MQKVLFLSLLILQVSYGSVLGFYQDALKSVNLKMQQSYINSSKKLQISALKINRAVNITSGISYSKTKAKRLTSNFSQTNIFIKDTIDIFNQNKNKIKLLSLSMQGKSIMLNIQKRALFISLVNMLGAYQKTKAVLNMRKSILKEQLLLQQKLKKAVQAGGKPRLEYLRFTNAIALLKYKVTQEQGNVNAMRATLHMYAPDIPKLLHVKLHANLAGFIAHDPVLRLNKNKARQSLAQATMLKRLWLPKAFIGVNRQYDNDPTANGNNYSVLVGLSMHFKGGRDKSIQAATVNALNTDARFAQLLVKQKAMYISWHNRYDISKKSLHILKPAVKLAQNNLADVKIAYIKHYINLTSYLHALNMLITTRISYTSAKYNNITSALILNNLSKGTIYE